MNITYSSIVKLKAAIEKEGKCKILKYDDLTLTVLCDNKKIRYTLSNGDVITTLIVNE